MAARMTDDSKQAKQAPQPTPYRQIRALYDDDTVTVYQAYSAAIASPAVAAQRLDASPMFSKTRMTWIKPSWAWMLYRAGYSYKDSRQERILALKVRRADFVALLEKAVLTHGRRRAVGSPARCADDEATRAERGPGSGGGRKSPGGGRDGRLSAVVNVQWDPERTVRLGRLEHRSIQIGIPAALCGDWVARSIVAIEDVTDKARELKRVLDADPGKTHDELVGLGLVPVERPFEVSAALRETLEMRSEKSEIG